MVNSGVMNTSKAPRRRQRTAAAECAQILATFERSGLSAAAFTRQHGPNYTTFSGWRRRQATTIGLIFHQIHGMELTTKQPNNKDFFVTLCSGCPKRMRPT